MDTVLNNVGHHARLYAQEIAEERALWAVVLVTVKQDVIQVAIISVVTLVVGDVLLDAVVSAEVVEVTATATAHLPRLMLVHAQQTVRVAVKQDVIQVAIIRVNRNVFLDAVLDVRDVVTHAQMVA